jgi:hypothetical protein
MFALAAAVGLSALRAEATTLQALFDGGILDLGDKVAAGWTPDPSDIVNFDPDDVTVGTNLSDPLNPQITFTFSPKLTVDLNTPNIFANFDFVVSADAERIKDISISFGDVTRGSGGATVSATTDEGVAFRQFSDGEPETGSDVDFDPRKSVDITFLLRMVGDSGTVGNPIDDPVSVGSVTIGISQIEVIPLPATAVLYLGALIVVGAWRLSSGKGAAAPT